MPDFIVFLGAAGAAEVALQGCCVSVSWRRGVWLVSARRPPGLRPVVAGKAAAPLVAAEGVPPVSPMSLALQDAPASGSRPLLFSQ